MALKTSGALVGWKYDDGDNGIVLTVQVTDSVERFRTKDFDRVQLSMNDRQLRSLARDLRRAAEDRGVPIGAAPRPWWRLPRWPRPID